MAVKDSVKVFVAEHDKVIRDAQEDCTNLCGKEYNLVSAIQSSRNSDDSIIRMLADRTKRNVEASLGQKSVGAKVIMDTCMGEASVEIEKLLKQNKEENYESVKYLLETMKRWLNEYSRFDLKMPQMGWFYSITASEEVKALIRGNEEAFQDDPVMKIVELKIRKKELLDGVKKSKELVITKKADLNAAESKYQELTSNYDANAQKAVEEAKNESIALGESIVSEERTLGNMEDDLRRLSSELSSMGIFSSSKKKQTEVLVADKKEQIEKQKWKISELQRKKSEASNSKEECVKRFDDEIEALKNKKNSLTEEIAALEQKIAPVEEMTASIQKSLTEGIAALKEKGITIDEQDKIVSILETSKKIENESKRKEEEEKRIREVREKENAIKREIKINKEQKLGDFLFIAIGSAVILAVVLPCILSAVHSATTHTYVDATRSGVGIVTIFIAVVLIIIPWVAFFEPTTKVIVIIGSIIILLGGVCMGIGSTVSSDAPYGSGPIVITGMVLICSGVIFFVSMCWYYRFKGRERRPRQRREKNTVKIKF